MGITWVVVAHRAGARILEHRGPGKGLRLEADVENAAGRLKSSEINSDKPGESFSSGTSIHGGHPMGTEENAHDHVAANFARQLADILTRGRNDHRFKQLVLVAEPGFLGLLRGKLDGETASMDRDSVGKDLAHVAVHDMKPHLEGVLAV
jgi:protein required for attachment to host cells